MLEQHAAGEQKPNRPGFAGEFLGTGAGVLGQGVGRAIENVGGDFVALGPCGEHFAGQAGDFGLVGLGDPVDELVGGVELQPAEQPLAKRRPRAVAVEIKHAGLEGAQADFVAAAFVAENVAPAADLGRGAVGRLAEAAGAGAAEHEHAGGRFALGVGSEGGFEIVGGVDGGAWPSAGGGAAESQFIGGSAGAGHADGDGAWLGELLGDLPEMPSQLRVVEQPEVGRAEPGTGDLAAALVQRNGVGGAALDAKQSGHGSVLEQPGGCNLDLGGDLGRDGAGFHSAVPGD